MIHLAVYLKLIQHCKSTIPQMQFKKKKKISDYDELFKVNKIIFTPSFS